VTRYAPAARLHELRTLLDGEGVTIYDVAERFKVSARTALRYVQALQRAGEPLYEETSGKRKVWRLMPAVFDSLKIPLTTYDAAKHLVETVARYDATRSLGHVTFTRARGRRLHGRTARRRAR